MDTLAIYQIEFHGHCGVTEEERTIGQRLSVDVEMKCDVSGAARTDQLKDTIDYDQLCGEIVKIGRESHVRLIETLAERIAGKILEDRRIASVTVRVKKCLPPAKRSGEVLSSKSFGAPTKALPPRSHRSGSESTLPDR
ncbi:MAG: dihydroneopterin aldolase [Candidatus Manganitrophus sp.]|nr:dihydroneopterin aldolase [Candidatus Manganitrophus sp.]